MSLDSAAWAALLGALAGALAVTAGSLVIELLFKPAHGSKRAALVLLEELRLNERVLEAVAANAGKPGALSSSFHLSTRGWQVVIGEIHYLPSEVLKSALLRYAQFDELNGIAANYNQKVDRLLTLEHNSPQGRALAREVEHDLAEFERAVPTIRDLCASLIPRMQEVTAGFLPNQE